MRHFPQEVAVGAVAVPLAADKVVRLRVAAQVHHQAGGLVDELLVVRELLEAAVGGTQRPVVLAHLHVGRDELEIVVAHLGIHVDPALQVVGRLGQRAVPQDVVAGLDVAAAHVGHDQRVVREDVEQALQRRVGLDVVVQLAVEGDLAAPQVAVVGLDFQQLVDVADGAGIVLQVVFHVHQEALGLDLVVIALDGADQVVARLVHVADHEIVIAIEVAQVRIVGDDFQTLVDLTFGRVPCVRAHVGLGPAYIAGDGRFQALGTDFSGQGKNYIDTG